ncbi:MAG: protein-methionine-sulfoxide reductase heme-binding subunit MsrQ [Pseudomonadota bacterium]
MNTLQQVRFILKPVVFLACLVPLALAIAGACGVAGQSLGANPAEALLEFFGIWGLRFLLLGLAVTPLRKLTGIGWIARFRRMVGLFGAFYVGLHFTVYLVLDQGLALGPILEDIVKRPYITVGFAAVLILTAMTLTSTASARRRLGRKWQKLHYGTYAAGILGVWHFWWQVKKDITEPLIYAAILAALLSLRIAWKLKRRPAPRATATGVA